MNILDILGLVGGLSIFLFGRKIMSENLDKLASSKMRNIIETLTGNVFKGILVGMVVTAVIHCSGATTVMVVGLVNSGLMSLNQAVGVIMGANIGTTVTAQMLRLGDIQASAWYIQILNTRYLAFLFLAVGVLISFSSSPENDKLINTGNICIGLGLLFVGMTTMETSATGLSHSPAFSRSFLLFQNNPVLLILIGAFVTAILQSSTASVGILQALASTGIVTYSLAMPIVMGLHIGTCVTAILSSVGANKNARRAALIHLYFNVIGAIVLSSAIYGADKIIHFTFWNNIVSRGNIADFHSMFNIVNVLVMLPFNKLLVKLADISVQGSDKKNISLLDERLLSTTSLAVHQCTREIVNMANIALKNCYIFRNEILSGNFSKLSQIKKNENQIDYLEDEILSYLGKLVEKPMSYADNQRTSLMFHVINDFERIGDHIMNITIELRDLTSQDSNLSNAMTSNIYNLTNGVIELVEMSIESYDKDDLEIAAKIEPFEQVIDFLTDSLKEQHIERLKSKELNASNGIVYLEMLGHLERVADHCSNVALAVVQQHNIYDESFNRHTYKRLIHKTESNEYIKIYDEYLMKYASEFVSS